MSQRKGWESLSPNYRQRLTSNGITASAYSQGASLQSARGHRNSPERATYRKRAEAARIDIRTFLPDYDELSKSEQEEAAKAFTRGVIGKASGPINKKTGKRKPSAAQVRSKMDFLDLIEQDGEANYFWREFRTVYADSFAAAA